MSHIKIQYKFCSYKNNIILKWSFPHGSTSNWRCRNRGTSCTAAAVLVWNLIYSWILERYQSSRRSSVTDCLFSTKTKSLRKVTHIPSVLMFGSAINYTAFAPGFFTQGVISLSFFKFFFDRASKYRIFQITNLMTNSFILQQYVCYITILNMFRAARCSSSGGHIVLPQPLVSSPSVNSRTVCRLRADCSPLSTGILYGCLQRLAIPEAVVIQFVLLRMSRVLLETCWGS